jgi:hypothetical protein
LYQGCQNIQVSLVLEALLTRLNQPTTQVFVNTTLALHFNVKVLALDIAVNNQLGSLETDVQLETYIQSEFTVALDTFSHQSFVN